MADAPQKITADKLCVLTGLTDRRHRQLAAEGWFPPPIESQYILSPVIQGLFRYYRESNKQTKLKTSELKDEKLKKEARLLDIKIAKEERTVVERVAVDAMLLRMGSLQKTVLHQKLTKEMPVKATAHGAPVEPMRLLGEEMVDALCEIFRQEMENWQEVE